jgi:23S rRNA pseudouridine1911/1915/1917 synthase
VHRGGGAGPDLRGGGKGTTGELTLRASEEDAGARLDAFLAARGAAASRAAAQRLIEAGRVSVDGARRAKNHRIEGAELVRVERAPEPAEPQRAPRFAVVHEDRHLLIVDKPAGLVTHPAPGHSGPTLAQALAGRAAGGPDPGRAGIVHRLDRDTSGLLVVARSEEAHAALQAMIRRRELTREYLALVEGGPDAERGTIDAPLGRDRTRRALVSTRTDRARHAVTHFRVLERLARTTLLGVRLETGRTHQIRAHLAAIGHPVCGDARYGGGACGERLGLERQFLHATRLGFSHPMGGEWVSCESAPPADLRGALEAARREAASAGPGAPR